MHITVVAVLCHSIAAVTAAPVCREEIVVEGDMSMNECMINQAALADWKMHSIFRGDQWTIARYKCIPGDYVIKDRA